MEERPGFIVPPPGLIPARPPQDAPAPPSIVAPAAPPTPRTPGTPEAPAPASAAPGRSLPAFRPPAAAPAPPRAEPQWRLVLPGGQRIPVAGTVLLGRNPSRSARPGLPPDAELVALDDPTSTVSKTHAAVEAVDGALRVTDLHSTNGVVVAAAGGTRTRATPGEPVDVPDGAEVRLGDHRLRAERS